MTINITLAKISAADPCTQGWRTLLAWRPVGDRNAHNRETVDQIPFPLANIVVSNGLDDALWCTRCLPEHKGVWLQFSLWALKAALERVDPERYQRYLRTFEAYVNDQSAHNEGLILRMRDELLEDNWPIARQWRYLKSALHCALSPNLPAVAWLVASASANALSLGGDCLAQSAAYTAVREQQKVKFLEMIK